MIEIKITLRQKEILKKICSEYKYVTLSSIAEKLDISSRTVLRELSGIEKWLKHYGCLLDKKAGIGIRLKGSLEDRKRLMDILEEEKETRSYSPNERQIIIISELLQNKEPVKLYSFTKKLNVTEGTVSHDLDKIDGWLRKYDLNLVRKPGLGVYLEGHENEIRKAIINLIYENINEEELHNLVKESITDDEAISGRLLNLIDKQTIRKLEDLILELEQGIGYRMADNAYIGLLVHLTLAIQRIKKNEKIRMDKIYLDELRKYSEYNIAKELTEKISSAFDIEIPEDEIGYITMHLRGSKGFGENYQYNNLADNSEVGNIINEMVSIAEAETGSFLAENEKLHVGLKNHLVPAINRLKMKLDIRNPLLNEIKESYPKLFSLAAKCALVVERHIGIKMPDSEIGYIAMHLGAALESKDRAEKKIFKILVACATGFGTSRLLTARIEKEYDNIEIVDAVSTLHIHQKFLMEKGIDFIISTVPIKNTAVPVVVINPLLLEGDRIKIDNLIKNLKDQSENYLNKGVKAPDLKEKLSRLKIYMDGIIQVLNNFFIYEFDIIKDVNELIKMVSSSLVNNDENKELLEKDMKLREEKGSTVLYGLNTILLHCRTRGIESLHFGAVRIKNSFSLLNAEDKQEEIKLALIMLAPENCHKEYIEVLGFISSMLIDKPEFATSLKKASRDEVYLILNSCLEEFYRMKNS